jgi:hypothetical protein
MMATAGSSETLAFTCQNARRHISEGRNIQDDITIQTIKLRLWHQVGMA